MHVWSTLDDGKAERNRAGSLSLVHDSIRRAAQFSPENRLRGKNR